MLLTITTLTKIDNRSLDRILKSILEQEISHQIESLVVDVSKEDNQEYRKNKIYKFMDKKTKFKILKELLFNKKIFYLRKFVFIIKYFLPRNLFNFYSLLQFLKSKKIDIIL